MTWDWQLIGGLALIGVSLGIVVWMLWDVCVNRPWGKKGE